MVLVCNSYFVGLDRPLAPKFPLRISIKTKDNTDLFFFGIMKAISENHFESIVLYRNI